ncbi:YibE/F family protein [Actinomadura sp. 3N407]|uniref:YibE/F family protein n=1 Tax=Actinomadura sp. 3N407 TaxID=3457423 RepID=UPI003FCDBDBD
MDGRGLTALIGLAVTFALLVPFLIPAIIDGRPPMPVAIVCAAATILAVLYLTHGDQRGDVAAGPPVK